MKNIYKGRIILRWFKNKPYSWVSKTHFYTIIKKLFGKMYIIVKYKKNTQYYKPRMILKLRKFVDLHICQQTQGQYIIDGSLDDLYKKKTILIRCLSKQDGSYIGCPFNTYKLLDLGITRFYKLIDDEDNSVFGKNTATKEWYCWNGKDIAKIGKDINFDEAKQIVLDLYQPVVSKPDNYIDTIKKEMKNETKYIINQIKNHKENQ